MNDGERLDPLRSVNFYFKFFIFRSDLFRSTGRQFNISDRNQEKHMASKSTPSCAKSLGME